MAETGDSGVKKTIVYGLIAIAVIILGLIASGAGSNDHYVTVLKTFMGALSIIFGVTGTGGENG